LKSCHGVGGVVHYDMVKNLTKILEYLFYLFFFLTPLAFLPMTSELFEFNKILLTYIFTVLIFSLWILRMLTDRKVIFRRTMLDIPLIIFLISQTLSSLISVDPRTSLLGYYSRFNGGLLSYYSYAVLYWAYVSNMDYKGTIRSLKVLLGSAGIVSIWGILEHFGHSVSCFIIPPFRTFDVSCWMQDVQTRVFASLGQPNWLAAWIIALIPLTWAFALNSKFPQKSRPAGWWTNSKKYFFWLGLSALFFITLLFTKSRSGILGFTISFFLFWPLLMFFYRRSLKTILPNFFLVTCPLLLVTFLVGTPWTPKLKDIINKPTTNNLQPTTPSSPALEVGGTESGKIRQIVWKGAIDIWKHYPILGSGVETFAFSYYNFRSAEHNLVSEWDFLYNKAHNEYLNFAATTGSIGLLAYLFLIGAGILQIGKGLRTTHHEVKGGNLTSENLLLTNGVGQALLTQPLRGQALLTQPLRGQALLISFLAGFTSILVTNFFGFSVVVVALQFFLYPAFASTLAEQGAKDKVQSNQIIRLTNQQIFLSLFVLCAMLFALSRIAAYWYADYLYAQGKLNNDAKNYVAGREFLNKAIKLSSKEAIFWNELSKSTSFIALMAATQKETELAQKLAGSAVTESGIAVSLSPANVNLKRDRASVLINLSSLNENYIFLGRDSLLEATKLAPTEAKLIYNLALAQLRTGDYGKAIATMETAVSLKPNYRNARYTLSLMYIDTGEKEKAKTELEYILTHIAPDDSDAKKELEELGSQ